MSLSLNIGAAAEAITAKIRKFPSWPLLERSGERVANALKDYIRSPFLKTSNRNETLRVLARLDHWLQETDRVNSLTNLSESDIDDFFSSFSSRETALQYRRSLRYAFDDLRKNGIVETIPISRAALNPPNDKLPELVTRLGERATKEVMAYIEELHSSEKRDKTRSMIRRLAAWAEEQHIYDLRDFSPGDGRLYLAAQRDAIKQRDVAYILRPLFQILINAKALVCNPFPYVAQDKATHEAIISPILAMARPMGSKAEESVRALLFKESGVFDDYQTCTLNHFVGWLKYEQIRSFASVSPEILLRYRTLGLSHLSKSSQATYFVGIARLFRELHAKRHIKDNPSPVFRRGKNIEYSPLPAFAEITEYSTKRTTSRARKPRRTLEIKYAGNFSELDVQFMPFRDRLVLARFVGSIERGVTRGTPISSIVFVAPVSEYRWTLLEQTGATTRNSSSEARCTPAFIKRYLDGDELRLWAQDFVARYEANVKFYRSSKQDSQQITSSTPSRMKPREYTANELWLE